MAASEMEAEAVDMLPDPASDLEEPEAQRIELHAGDMALCEPAPNGIKEPIPVRGSPLG